MRIIEFRETIDPSRESIGDFSPHMTVLRRHFCPSLHFQCCMSLQGTLGGNVDIFAASDESTAWVLLKKNPFKTNCREGLSGSPIQLFQHHI